MKTTDPKFSQYMDKVIGCFMGAAIGDAMGGPVECQHYRRIAKVLYNVLNSMVFIEKSNATVPSDQESSILE